MDTLQDLNAFERENERIDFCLSVIRNHKSSEDYRLAQIANEYDRQRNTTIMNYKKFLYNLRGQAVPDRFTANYKLPSNFFNSFVTQQNQYLLGNGVFLTTADGGNGTELKTKLGKDFDTRLQQAGRAALIEKCAFGFWNLDHLEVFRFTEFAPLYDEETGALGAGIRFWQIDEHKPMRFTLYEKDGYTEYIRKQDVVTVLREKRPYKLITRTDGVNGLEIVDGENYPGFPIVTLWGNPNKQSSIVGLREKIDCYDLIESGFANDLDDVSSIYWIIHNAGGMDDMDLAKFVEHMKTVKAATVDSDAGTGAEAHTVEVPHTARETYLTRLEADMYKDFQIVNVSSITGGQRTATEIQAAYQPMDTKVDMFEYCVIDFLQNLFAIVGIDAMPTFKRNRVANQTEETQMVMAAAQYLDDETLLRKLPWLTPDEVETIMSRRVESDAARFLTVQEEPETEE